MKKRISMFIEVLLASIQRYCHIFSVLVALMVFFGCSKVSDNKTIIRGTVDDPSIIELYVSKSIFDANSIYDTIKVKNGKYSYSMSSVIPDIRKIRDAQNKIDLSFITEHEEIEIDFIGNKYTVEGTLNERFKDYHERALGHIMKKQQFKKLINDQSEKGAAKSVDSSNISAEILKLEANIRSLILEMFSMNKSNAISAFAILSGRQFIEGEAHMFDSLYYQLDSNVLEDTHVGVYLEKETKKRIASKELALTLPDEELDDVNQKVFKIQTKENIYLFIDFWAYWCKPCRNEIPIFKDLYKKLRNELDLEIEFISISTDLNVELWKDAIEKDDPTWEQFIMKDSESKERFSAFWGIQYLPHGVLIDPTGKTIKNGIKSAKELELFVRGINVN